MSENTVFKIGSRVIDVDKPVMVIAEIGVNHDGSPGRALDLVHHAHKAGADAVKLQLFRAATLMHASAGFALYQQPRATAASAAAMLQKYELSDDDIQRIVEAIRNKGMTPLATPFSPADVEMIEKLDLPAIKIASPDLVNRPLIERAALSSRPLIISTGAATMDEVASTAQWLRTLHAKFALLHCVSSYPTSAGDANLCWIQELHARFEVPVGFSDHTTELLSGALAVTAGACIVERHITHDKSAPGPDHAASASPGEFARYVQGVRMAQLLRGQRGKSVLASEKDVRRASRQSLVAQLDIPAGEVITRDHLIVQRPGTGVPAAEVTSVVGRRSRRAISAGTLLTWDMIADAA
ncbi:MAG: N-acetylneuraminate synthase family protein [Tepidisphaeraceae bacterium]